MNQGKLNILLKRGLSLLLILMLLLTLAGCGRGGQGGDSAVSSGDLTNDPDMSEPEPEPVPQPFTLGYYTKVGFQPYTCVNTLNRSLSGLLYDPLVELDGTMQVVPALAESVSVTVSGGPVTTEPPTGSPLPPTTVVEPYVTNVTISLRSDVRFQDGSAMEAADVVYSLEQARGTESLYAARFANVTSIKAQGKSTVTLQIAGASAQFDRLLDIPIIKKGTAGKTAPVGTGAYRLRLDSDGNAVALERNPDWWREEVMPLEEIPLYAAKDSDYLLYGFGSGEVSLVPTDLTGSNSLGFQGNFQVADYPTTTMLYLGCNTVKGKKLANEKLRSGIYYALDRTTLAKKILSGHAQATSLPISPSDGGFDEALAETLGQDVEKAKTLVGKEKSLTLIVNGDSQFKLAVAKTIAEQLEAVGLNVTVKELSWSDFKAALNGTLLTGKERSNVEDYDLYLGEVRLTADYALEPLLAPEGSLNYAAFADEALTGLYETFRSKQGEARAAAAGEFYKAMAEQAPFLPLCFKSESVVYQWNTLTSLTPTQQNLFYHFYEWAFVENS